MVGSIIALLLCSALWLATTAAAAQDCEREIDRSARKHGVPAEVLHAVGQTETGRGDGLRPNAVNIAGQSHYDLSVQQALALFAEAQRRGIKLIDIGCMQINHHYHKQHFTSVAQMLEPARNVEYAARFLKQLYTEEGNWTMAVARYHAGKNNTKAQRRYVCAVIGKLVAAGQGAWTPEARRFCGQRLARCSDGGIAVGSNNRGPGETCASLNVAGSSMRNQPPKTDGEETDWAVTISEAGNPSGG